MPQPRPHLSIAAHQMKAGGVGNGMEAQERFNTGCCGGVMAAAVLVRRDVMVIVGLDKV